MWKQVLGVLLWSQFSFAGLYHETDQFERDVRDQKYTTFTGGPTLNNLLGRVHSDYNQRGCRVPSPTEAWAFPIAWHGNNDIGGTNGNGYKPHGFQYFAGILTKGHSAHDIFIHDRNYDILDDRYQQLVPVLAVEPGVIISTQNQWDPQSGLKAGLYINVFHPHNNQVSYYSHLSQVSMKPGDCVDKGQPIGSVGRTGLNANSRRSPSHLHFGRLQFNGSTYLAVDPYQQLLKSQKISFPKTSF